MASSLQDDYDVVVLIPRLRELALKYRPNSQATADELLVLALQDAVADLKNRPPDIELFDWVHCLMLKHLN